MYVCVGVCVGVCVSCLCWVWTAISSTRAQCSWESFGPILLDCEERSSSDSSLVVTTGPRAPSVWPSTLVQVTSCCERSTPPGVSVVVATGFTLAVSCSSSFQSATVLSRGPVCVCVSVCVCVCVCRRGRGGGKGSEEGGTDKGRSNSSTKEQWSLECSSLPYISTDSTTTFISTPNRVVGGGGGGPQHSVPGWGGGGGGGALPVSAWAPVSNLMSLRARAVVRYAQTSLAARLSCR